MDPGGSARAAVEPSGQETVTARIQLDTGFLIRTLIRRTAEESALRSLLTAQTALGISTVAWAEFLCGPLTPDAVRQARLLIGQPLPFTEADAEMAAQLFNRGGRRRGTLADCMVAAAAIRDQSVLATTNRKDFERFQTEGLKIL